MILQRTLKASRYEVETGDERCAWTIEAGPSCLLVALLSWGFAWMVLVLPLLQPITGHLWPDWVRGVPGRPEPLSWILGPAALLFGLFAFLVWRRRSELILETAGSLRVTERGGWGLTQESELARARIDGVTWRGGRLWVTFRDGADPLPLRMPIDTGSDGEQARLVRLDVQRFNERLRELL